MQENFQFSTFKQIVVKNENVGAILFDVDAKTSADAVADISNLNDVRVDITLKRESKKEPIVIYKGFLQNLLNVFYQQSTELELVMKKLTSGYKIILKFKNLPITLMGDDELVLDLNFPTSAFTSSTKANSTVTVETIEADAPNATGMIAVYDSFVPTVGKSSFDDKIGSNIVKILLEIDNAATYDASNLAKPVDVDILAQGDFSKKQTQNALIAQNMQMLHYNPTSDVKNLWLYNSNQRLLDDVTCRIKFDKAVTNTSLIQVQRLIFA